MRTPGTIESYVTSFSLPRDMRSRLDNLRLVRAQRDGSAPPPMRSLILEGLEGLLARELDEVKR
jgi:hypothetical protein